LVTLQQKATIVSN